MEYFVSYYDQHGMARTKPVTNWMAAMVMLASKAIKPEARPVLITDTEGNVLHRAG